MGRRGRRPKSDLNQQGSMWLFSIALVANIVAAIVVGIGSQIAGSGTAILELGNGTWAAMRQFLVGPVVLPMWILLILAVVAPFFGTVLAGLSGDSDDQNDVFGFQRPGLTLELANYVYSAQALNTDDSPLAAIPCEVVISDRENVLKDTASSIRIERAGQHGMYPAPQS